MIDYFLGVKAEDCIAIVEKLAVIGIDPHGLLEFLDRDKVQLFAEQELEIKQLKLKLFKIGELVSASEEGMK